METVSLAKLSPRTQLCISMARIALVPQERELQATHNTTHRHDRVEKSLESDEPSQDTFDDINRKARASIAKMYVDAS